MIAFLICCGFIIAMWYLIIGNLYKNRKQIFCKHSTDIINNADGGFVLQCKKCGWEKFIKW